MIDNLAYRGVVDVDGVVLRFHLTGRIVRLVQRSRNLNRHTRGNLQSTVRSEYSSRVRI